MPAALTIRNPIYGAYLKARDRTLRHYSEEALEARFLGLRPAAERLFCREVKAFLSNTFVDKAADHWDKACKYSDMLPDGKKHGLCQSAAKMIYDELVVRHGRVNVAVHLLENKTCSLARELNKLMGEMESAKARSEAMQAFGRFAAAPDNLYAEVHLNNLFESVDAIGDPEQKQALARDYAIRILESVGSSREGAKEYLVSCLRSLLGSPSAIRQELESMQERSDPSLGSDDREELLKRLILEREAEQNPADQRNESRVLTMHIDRNGVAHEIETMPKRRWESMMSSLWATPKKKILRYVIIAGIALVTSIGAATAYYVARTRSNITIAGETRSISDMVKDYQDTITKAVENDESVAEAVVAATKGKGGKVTPESVSDFFDHVIRRVTNARASHPNKPRKPKMTGKGEGDCKAQIVLLASMIEYRQGHTIVLLLPKGEATEQGHVRLGVRVSRFSSGEDANMARMLVEDYLIKRYGQKAKNPVFMSFQEKGIPGLYLMLDTTFADKSKAVPGKFATGREYGDPIVFFARPGINHNKDKGFFELD